MSTTIRGYFKNMLASAARAASSSSAIDLGLSPDVAVFYLTTTVKSGTTPTLDVYLQHSIDSGATYQDFAHFPQVTATGVIAIPWASFANATNNTASVASVTTGDAVISADRVINGMINASYVRVKYVIGGTNPSFTFKVDMLAKRDA